ncbi:Uncharacterised protein [Vibrio cholerae]|nr:Uncharacterised protein [Vibrio cholerae]CSI45904.1 Uncharacterised protein [Vibrio cholerae]
MVLVNCSRCSKSSAEPLPSGTICSNMPAAQAFPSCLPTRIHKRVLSCSERSK